MAKRLRAAVWAAVLMACLGTTVIAAAYMGLDEMFMKFLNPANHEQAEYLSNGAYVVDKKVKNENGTLDIKQVIGDSNLTYILMDFSAPEGMVLDAARYRFLENDITISEDYRSVGFKALHDDNPSDNKISLVMSILTKNAIVGQNVHFQLKDLQAADPFPGMFTTVIPGAWETEFKLDFKEYSTPYEVNENISMFGYGAVLQTVSVSPISISLKIVSHSMNPIREAAGSLKEAGVNQHLDHYPITIKYQDGTSETTSLLNGVHLTENGTHLLTINMFEHVINSKEIASIVFSIRKFLLKNETQFLRKRCSGPVSDSGCRPLLCRQACGPQASHRRGRTRRTVIYIRTLLV